MVSIISQVGIAQVASHSDSRGRPKSERSAEMERAVASALESEKMEVTFDIMSGESFTSVASRARSIAAKVGARVYIRKHKDGEHVKVLVMGRS